MCTSETGCACSTTATTTTAANSGPGAVQAVYDVAGMTCGGCAARVSKQLVEIGGVSDVSVDVAAGKVAVTSAAPLAIDTVKASVAQAGYQLLG
jgi:copper chaperone CopZ